MKNEIRLQELKQKIDEILTSGMQGKRYLLPIYAQKEWMEAIVTHLAEPYSGKVEYVAAPESLGFILGAMLADRLGVGFIPIQDSAHAYLKNEDMLKAPFIDHRNRSRAMVLKKGLIPEGSRVLLVDDWVETAATIQSCATLIEEADGIFVGITSIGVDDHAAVHDLIDRGLLHCIYKR